MFHLTRRIEMKKFILPIVAIAGMTLVACNEQNGESTMGASSDTTEVVATDSLATEANVEALGDDTINNEVENENVENNGI
jgi:lipoprotein|nr:MAG TPA: protein of unknown function (DUF4969) [Caudoviricetes sp.]DAX55659.1 MAG TPA: protein of unknown function (DUF4969) [Caudoviricetes sp.]